MRFTGGEIVIATGCDGIDGMIIIIAAVLAFPLGLADRGKGLVVGVAVMYLANLVRIIGLLYIFRFKPSLFDHAHIYAGQTFIIFVGFLFYTAWLNRIRSIHES